MNTISYRMRCPHCQDVFPLTEKQILNNMTFTCPKYEVNQPCPACAKAEQLKRTGSTTDYEAAKDLFAKRRILAVVVDRENPERGPVPFEFGVSIEDALVTLRRDEDAGGDFTNVETGFDIIVERKGQGKNDTEYAVMPARKQSPLGNTGWVDAQPNLDALCSVSTPDEIRAMFSGAKTEKPVGGSKLAAAAAPRGPTAEDAAMTPEVVGPEDGMPF